MHEEVLLVD